MKAFIIALLLVCCHVPAVAQPSHDASSASSGSDLADARVTIANGTLQGITEPSGVHVFKGVPFAAPPVRDRRWKPPQQPGNWEGVRKADRFAAQCMQERVFGDMNFRNSGISEDCLYLNVWTPAESATEKLPVLVYFYGGGFVAGDGSEPRYDGESMAQKGIVAVTMSYRLGIFGFFAHPELTQESPHHASGNYALMDQAQALRWVQQNIAAFGGDPDKVTIAGESAGSFSVSAQMASPLAKGLFAGAIGESGSVLGSFAPVPLTEAEQQGVAFAKAIGASSLEALRAISATELLAASSRPGMPRFALTVDGYFFPRPPLEIYAAGEQAHVPLLVGWNSEEMNYHALLGSDEPTPENFARAVQKRYGDNAGEILKLYSASTKEETIQSATDLAGDRFIGFSTWKWFDVHRRTGDAPVYRYYYAHPRPAMVPEMGDAVAGLAGGVVRGADAEANRPPPPTGAVHSAEIEYAMGNLATNKVYAWTADDYKVSETMQGYFANFIKTGDPNGPGLPRWPAAGEVDDQIMLMRLDVNARAEPAKHRDRYLFLDRLSTK
ncbi:MAG TPA: carboxylesterase family protein [Rhodothermales bacterium]|nr:carboxylesterase family protein [Rhodothermales bacterium]